MRGKITKRSVDALKRHASRDVFLWDDKLSGFGVRVKPSGSTSFTVAYYAPGLHRTRRRITLGAYGPLTVDVARDRARALLAAVAAGDDPALEKADGRRSARDETVERLFGQYLAYAGVHYKPRTVAFYESLGRLYLLPAIGELPVAKVSARDIARLHHDLRQKPVTANRVIQLTRALFYWLGNPARALFSGQNPARHLELYAERGRERFLTVEEMARLGHALRLAETVGLPPAPGHSKKRGAKRAKNVGMFSSKLQPANPVAIGALRFLMFTGWREQEALTLQWADINMAAGTATLRDTKTGKSVRTLSAPVRALLSDMPRVKESPFVFPGRDPMRPLREMQRLWYAARHQALLDDVRLHDLRHSVASFAGGRGYSLFLIGKLLGHRDQRSTARYAHLADDIRQTMADDVAESIRDAMDADMVRSSSADTPKKLVQRVR